MNCYLHTDVSAVATCSQGCGRSLCPDCTEAYDPPTCRECADRIEEGFVAEVAQSKSAIIKKMIINALFYIPWIIFISHMGNQADTPYWLIIPFIVWGFFGFRWLMDAFLRVTGLTIFNTLQGWGWTYFVGSMVVGMFGFIVIPILLIMQFIQLRRLPKTS